jgi:5-methyltetrahydrofolate--homocysteine methyltransferase
MLVAMTSPNNRDYDADLLKAVSRRVLMGDGAMGAQLQVPT